MKIRTYLFATTVALLAPATAQAVTVTIGGKSYETASDVSIAAELGQTVTTSVAIKIGQTYESILAEHAALVASDPTSVPSIGYREEEWGRYGPDFYVQDPTQTSFSFSNAVGLTDDKWHYLAFDVTFAPTAATIASDELYSPSYGGDARFEVGYNTSGDDYMNYDDFWGGEYDPTGVKLFWFDPIGTYYVNSFSATVLQSSGVTPVPVPGALGLMAFGLIGLGAIGRKTKRASKI